MHRVRAGRRRTPNVRAFVSGGGTTRRESQQLQIDHAGRCAVLPENTNCGNSVARASGDVDSGGALRRGCGRRPGSCAPARGGRGDALRCAVRCRQAPRALGHVLSPGTPTSAARMRRAGHVMDPGGPRVARSPSAVREPCSPLPLGVRLQVSARVIPVRLPRHEAVLHGPQGLPFSLMASAMAAVALPLSSLPDAAPVR